MSYLATSGVVDQIGTAIKSGIDFYGKSQSDAAVADLARQQAAQQAAAAQAPAEFPVMPLVAVGVLGVVAFFMLRK
jgi:hypothetical protein